ncbi:unnamed protein product [Hydatigera taeniaeformis]|uniref:Mediator of RNA polymerase II transcription subunit 13 n=1 Tax=Hydatigena taeniaeformis TaxID=6205 RepID=A0A0R3WNS8_HYDTA|nr:unnamed protein product [Hydatigera taeniaeformis]
MYMTDQYPRLDGRSLEDSHTNIFALTDLSGIHYRVYSLREDRNYSIYDDPLLSAYNNCLRENLMCAWVRRKRVDTEPHKPDVFSNFSKELWVFWAQYSINFSFFLHGESTVCASLDIRRFPKFKSLTPRVLSLCEKSAGRFNVVLAPYGITAQLVVPPQAYTNDIFVDKELEFWKRFFPIRSPGDSCTLLNSSAHPNSFYLDFLTPNKSSPAQQQQQQQQQQCSRSDASSKRSSANYTEQLPDFVNVLIGGFRMRYPTCFVLLAEDQLTSLMEHLQDGPDKRLSLPPKSRQTASDSHRFPHPRLPLKQLPSTKRRIYLATRALQRALRFERSFVPELDCLHIRSRLLPQTTVDDAVFRSNTEVKSPQVVLPLHRRSGSISRMLCAFVSEIDASLGVGGGNNCDMPVSALRRQPSSTDPLMPKLSPQPSNSVIFGVGGVSTAASNSHSASVSVAVATSNLQATHHMGAAKPPCLFNSQNINPKESGSSYSKSKPMDWDEAPVSTMTPKLPRCVVRISQATTQQVKSLPPLTVKPEAMGGETSWLARQVANRCRRSPIVHLSYVDQVNFLDHSSTSFGDESM